MTEIVGKGSAIETRLISAIGIVAIIAFSASYFVQGGIGVVSQVGTWISQGMYFAAIATAIYILRTHAIKVWQRRPGWPTSILTLAFFFIFFIWKMAKLPGFSDYYGIITAVGGGGISCMVGYAYLSSMYRFRVNTWEKAVMAVTAVLCILTVSPLLPIFIPGSGAISVWLLNYPATAVSNVLWTTMYIGAAAVLARVFIGKEKLSAITGAVG